MGAGVGSLRIDSLTYFTEARTGRQIFLHSYWVGANLQSDGAGNIYFAGRPVNWKDAFGSTFTTCMLLRRRLSGAIEVIMGSTNGGTLAENALADSTTFSSPVSIYHVTRDGVVYFYDNSGDGKNRIWRRDLDGRLHRVFGGAIPWRARLPRWG